MRRVCVWGRGKKNNTKNKAIAVQLDPKRDLQLPAPLSRPPRLSTDTHTHTPFWPPALCYVFANCQNVYFPPAPLACCLLFYTASSVRSSSRTGFTFLHRINLRDTTPGSQALRPHCSSSIFNFFLQTKCGIEPLRPSSGVSLSRNSGCFWFFLHRLFARGRHQRRWHRVY